MSNEPFEPDSDKFDQGLQPLVSIAISLKRIADALGGGLFTAPINSYGEGIGDAIQGQIIRGNNGVSQYDR
jgi:hypothetical protein